jgi:hypothetical protein
LTDELVETNALAVNAFSWLQWEFESLVKLLSLPPKSRPDPENLSRRLNTLLNSLSTTLDNLHKHASSSHKLATRGSAAGQQLHRELSTLNTDLKRVVAREPGWKVAQEKAKHFFLGGEPTAAELVRQDLEITNETVMSLADLVLGLEASRSAIKAFRDQIGFFDASMMGYHLGAQGSGVAAEEEVQVLAGVVEEFGRAIGKAKGRWVDEGDDLADASGVKRLDAP